MRTNKEDRKMFKKLAAQLDVAAYVLTCIQADCYKFDYIADKANDIELEMYQLQELLEKEGLEKK